MKRRRLGRRAALVAAAVGPLSWLAIAPAGAALTGSSDQRTATVADVAEAWYAHSPIDICTTPLGCPPAQVPTSPYPAHTLHVGVAGGQESARAYVLPNLVSLPYAAKLLSGTMTLPVTTSSDAGTVSADAAKLQACLTTAPIPDGTEGSTQAPPAVDCKTKALLTYDAKKAVFNFDLTPFLAAWSAGKPALGIALLPAAGAPTDSWHVSFNGRKYAGSHIASTVVFTPPPSTGSGSTTTAPPPVKPPATKPAPQSPPDISLPPQSTGTPPAPAPQVATPAVPAPATQAVAVSRSFQYPLAFLFPIGLLVGAVFFIRLFTRDPLPVRPVR